jgi:predicted lipase
VYTFGQPKVGNDEFVYELKRHAPSTGFYRVTHNNDVVPSLPRKGYAHCGRRIFVSQDGLLIQVCILSTCHDTTRTAHV